MKPVALQHKGDLRQTERPIGQRTVGVVQWEARCDPFLGHCSDIMKIKNLLGIQLFTTRRLKEVLPPGEEAWVARNRNVLVQAAVNLHMSLCPFSRMTVQQIISSVGTWEFQPETGDVDLGVVHENSMLSFADQSMVSTYVEIRQGLFEQYEDTVLSTTTTNDVRRPMLENKRVHQGESNQLVFAPIH